MSFLTSGLGQPWYDESNTVGGLLSMQELTNARNFAAMPPSFPPGAGLAFNEPGMAGMGTLVDQMQRSQAPVPRMPSYAANEGATPRRRRPRRGGGGRGRARGWGNQKHRRSQRRAQMADAQARCGSQHAAMKAARSAFKSCVTGSTVAPTGANGASEFAVLSGIGSMGQAGQGAYLSPSQVDPRTLESGRTLSSQHQSFGGMGQAGQGNWVAPSQVARGQRESAEDLVSHPQMFGMGQLPRQALPPQALLRSAYRTGQIDLSPICDPKTGACLSYPTQAEINKAIGLKIGGQSALRQGQHPIQLPSFYQHPQLGPWGVDPSTAYRYWQAQQAAMQQAAVFAPLTIWGSPGTIPPTPPLQPSGVAQPASFNPYSQAFPVAGTAIEHF